MITPDTHYGYGVPVGCVLLTDYAQGAIAMGPVGYDIGCGMMSARSNVDASKATPEKRLSFNRAVMKRVYPHIFAETNRGLFVAYGLLLWSRVPCSRKPSP